MGCRAGRASPSLARTARRGRHPAGIHPAPAVRVYEAPPCFWRPAGRRTGRRPTDRTDPDGPSVHRPGAGAARPIRGARTRASGPGGGQAVHPAPSARTVHGSGRFIPTDRPPHRTARPPHRPRPAHPARSAHRHRLARLPPDISVRHGHAHMAEKHRKPGRASACPPGLRPPPAGNRGSGIPRPAGSSTAGRPTAPSELPGGRPGQGAQVGARQHGTGARPSP